MTTKTDWQKTAESVVATAQFNSDNEYSAYLAVLQRSSMIEGKTVYQSQLQLSGLIPNDELSFDGLSLNETLAYVHCDALNPLKIFQKIYTWGNGLAVFNINNGSSEETRQIYLTVHCTDLESKESIFSKFEKWKFEVNNDNMGRMYVITQHGNGLGHRSIGVAKAEFIEENYDKDVIRGVTYCIENLKSDSPNGRIVILNGEPGTGKTYLIRSMLDSIKNATFIVIPPEMTRSLNGPELMTFFLSYHFTSPIILVIEDADLCLVERQLDNISFISTLLNMSDGIIGNMLDIRMILTTNAEIKDIDQAITRPGRLIKIVNLFKLDADIARTIYERLGGTKTIDKPMTLAEIYSSVKLEKVV